MLGLRLSREIEESLDRYARDVGRSKSVIVRDWIVEKLEHESIDEQLRRAAHMLSTHDDRRDPDDFADATNAWLAALDAEDDGYDWGPAGPPT